jgi:hypothetical protein
LIDQITSDTFLTGLGADNPTLEKSLVTKSEEAILQLAEASEEGQGPRRAVEPMMMMTFLTKLLDNE